MDPRSDACDGREESLKTAGLPPVDEKDALHAPLQAREEQPTGHHKHIRRCVSMCMSTTTICQNATLDDEAAGLDGLTRVRGRRRGQP